MPGFLGTTARRWLWAVVAGGVLGGLPMALDAALVEWKAGSAADDVAAAMVEARSLAVARRQPVRLLVDEELRAVWVDGGRWRKLPDGVTLAGPPLGRDGARAITFRGDGSSSGGQVVVWWRGHASALLAQQADGRVRRVLAR